MGLLRDLESEKTSLLEPEHVVGRGHGCSLRLGHRFVSAQHAHLRWAHGRWEVKDLGSLNGTFLDGERIKPGDECPIKKGSRVAFGKVEKAWELVDDSGPQAMVVPLDGGDPILVEQELLVLPSDEDPRFTIYRSEGAWVLEQPNESTTPITNAQVFELEGRPWRFCCPESDWTTAVATAPNNLEVRHLQLVFLVSRDEELVEIRASSGDRSLSLGSRAFNYLLLTLARRRLADGADGASESDCGWVYQEDFDHDPSMAPAQLNIDVFRIRRHFGTCGIVDAASIIERRPRTRQLRIGTAHVSVVKR